MADNYKVHTAVEADYATIKEKNIYRTRAIITRVLYILNPLFEVQKRFFKDVFRKILPLCIVSIKERVMMARVR